MEYKNIDEIIPIDIEENTILNINTKNVNSFTHGFHKYPGKFIPQVPKWAIDKYLSNTKDKTVFDPFCGSGTTLVEGILQHHNIIGIDIDPLSVLISKVKTTKVDIQKLKKISNWLIDNVKNSKDAEYKPNCINISHWFTYDAIFKLSVIRTLIDKIPSNFGDDKKTKNIQDLILICFSSITRKVSNADNQSQKTYVSHTKIKQPEEVNSLFLKQLDNYQQNIIEFSNMVSDSLNNKILCTSSVNGINNILKNENIDITITSPPYIKAIDYIYNQMVELFWIGDLFEMGTQEKQNARKTNYIGNKQIKKVEYSDYLPFETIFKVRELDNKLQEVFTKDKKNGHKHSYISYKYFHEMEMHFLSMSKLLSKGTHYIMVVGDSKVSNIYFDTGDYLIKLAERNGFELTHKWGYKIKNRFMRFNRKGRGGFIEIDWVIDFKKK